MLLRTIAFHNKNLISKSSAVKTMPTQVWVGMVLTADNFEIKFLLWNAIVLNKIYFKAFLIKWKMWKFIIRRYNLCSKIWPFHLIINFYNFASKYTKFLYVTQNDWLSKISKFQSSVMKNGHQHFADWLPYIPFLTLWTLTSIREWLIFSENKRSSWIYHNLSHSGDSFCHFLGRYCCFFKQLYLP